MFCMLREIAVIFVIITIAGCENNNYKKDEIPKSIIAFGKSCPEAKEFVRNFNKYKDSNFNMDVSREMHARSIPLFIQWDKRWGYKRYGQNYLGIAGCGPSCMAMIVCGLTQNASINPYEVSLYSVNQGFYRYGIGTLWNLMTTGAHHYGLQAERGIVSKQYILTNLSAKNPMICSMAPGDFTKTGHFIVLISADEKGKIAINDPNSPKRSRKQWDANTLIKQIKAVWAYKRPRTNN